MGVKGNENAGGRKASTSCSADVLAEAMWSFYVRFCEGAWAEREGGRREEGRDRRMSTISQDTKGCSEMLKGVQMCPK